MPIDPLEHPGFLPMICPHGLLVAWVVDPVTLDVPEIEECVACQEAADALIVEGSGFP